MAVSGSDATRRQVPRRYLRRISWLAPLKSGDLDWVQQRFRRREYAAGETILRQGARGGFLGIIEQGQAEIVYKTPGGHRSTATLQAGDFFNTATLHDQTPSSVTVCAVTPIVVWMLDHADAAELGRRWYSTSRSPLLLPPRTWLSIQWLTTSLNMLRRKPYLVKLGLAAVTVLIAWAIATSPLTHAFLADVRYARGVWYLKQGQADTASQEFEAALKISPVHAASYNALGYIYYQQGQLEEALTAFEKASHLAFGSEVIQNNLGVVRNHHGETDKALESLRQAASLGGNAYQVYVNLGDLYMARGDWLNASRAYREALRLNPDLAVTHHNLGAAYHRLGQLDAARSEFEQAVRLDPNLGIAYVGLGVVAFERRQFDEAETALQHAVELNPQDAVTAYFYLGLIYKYSNRLEPAIDAFERALGLTSDPVVREQAEWHLKELWGLP
jgi:tetratricopeptide (TPR) repeat protein